MTHNFQVGDKVIMPWPVRRKWWQFWRPRFVGEDLRQFAVTHVASNEFKAGVDI
jgi:hypothetical protein